MARLNPTTLKPVESLVESKDFTDEKRQPGSVLSLRMRVPSDPGFFLAIGELQQTYIKKYITGSEGKAPEPMPPIDGRFPKITADLCLTIASFEMSDYPDTGDKPYNFLEWVIISCRMPDAFNTASDWLGSLINKARGIEKNESRAEEELESELPSNTEPRITLTS